jgi:WhiB family redox-sensing transcriptional regulator
MSDHNWRAKAACADYPDETFFPHPNDDARLAKRICAECPVAKECLTYALGAREPWGVWGGLTEQERRAIMAPRLVNGLPAAKCGTEPGYRRHLRAREAVCAACRSAGRAARARREKTA